MQQIRHKLVCLMAFAMFFGTATSVLANPYTADTETTTQYEEGASESYEPATSDKSTSYTIDNGYHTGSLLIPDSELITVDLAPDWDSADYDSEEAPDENQYHGLQFYSPEFYYNAQGQRVPVLIPPTALETYTLTAPILSADPANSVVFWDGHMVGDVVHIYLNGQWVHEARFVDHFDIASLTPRPEPMQHMVQVRLERPSNFEENQLSPLSEPVYVLVAPAVQLTTPVLSLFGPNLPTTIIWDEMTGLTTATQIYANGQLALQWVPGTQFDMQELVPRIGAGTHRIQVRRIAADWQDTTHTPSELSNPVEITLVDDRDQLSAPVIALDGYILILISF